MKKTTYFSNRFASAFRGFRSNRQAKQLSAVASAPAASEFEALEARILLSGIGTGLNRKNATFFDADGDKITVTSLGKGAKFNIDLGGSTNNADIANIQIGAAGTSIGVVVTPVGSFTAPVQTKAFINPNWNLGDLGGQGNLSLDNLNQVNQKIQTQYYNLTPGYTNIGSITAAAGITTVGSIGLTAAVVPVIDLPGVAVGNINLSTGMVSKVDSFMATNGSYLADWGGWTSGLNNINLYDIDAGSIAGINIAGIDPATYNGPLGNAFKGNNFLGTITTDNGGIGRLTGTNSSFDGQISLGGTSAFLGNVVIGKGWAVGSSITATGDLTFTANGFNGVIDVGGHLNLALQGNSDGDFFAGKGISGLRAGTADSVIISNEFTGSLVAKGGDLAGVTIAGGGNLGTGGALFEADGKIGNIWSNAVLDQATIVAGTNIDSITLRGVNLAAGTNIFVGGTIGVIDIVDGNLDATIAASDFTEVSIRGGNITGTLLASNGIGDVTIVAGQLSGSLIAQGKAGIGEINVTNLAGGVALANGSVIYSGGDIAGITAATTGDTAVGNSAIQAVGTIGFFDAVAYGGGGGGGAIDGLTLIAPTIDNITATSIAGIALANSTFISTVGNVGSITATGLNGGMNTVTIISNAAVGSITGTAVKSNAGIQALSITAQGNIDGVTGTSLEGDGINGGINGTAFISVAGNIGNVTGSSTSAANNGNGINFLVVKAVAGEVLDITGTAAGGGNGLINVQVQADKGIGAISGSSFTSNGIDGGNYLAVNGNIKSVQGTTSEGVAIGGFATFKSIGGEITTINASPTGVGGVAVNNATFEAATIGNLEFKVANLAGGLAVDGLNVTATNGNVGTIMVTNDSLAAGATGLTNSNVTATGNIGQITVSAVGTASDAINDLDLTADSEGNDTGDVLGVTATSKQGSAIVDGIYTGANVGPISATVTALNGADAINSLTVNAIVGQIDAITATTASKGGAGAAITGGSAFTAETDIVSITATANTGNAINGSNFTATNGDIGNIKAITATGSAIVGSNFTGENVGNKIEATVTGDGNFAILNGSFEATDGNVSDIVAITNGLGGGDNAIDGLTVDATGDIKSITATANAGIAMLNGVYTADSDGDFAGKVGPIIVTSATGTGVDGAAFNGASIDSLTATVTGDGAAAIQGTQLSTSKGNVGNISASTASEGNGSAIDSLTITAQGNILNIDAKVTDADGGIAVLNSNWTANGSGTSNGTIGTLTVTSAADNAVGVQDLTMDAGIGVAGQAIGNITVALTKAIGDNAITNLTLDATNNPDAVLVADQKATIGTITTTGVNLGIAGLTVDAPVSIGAITSSGTGSQDVTLNAPTTGALEFKALGIGTPTVTVNVGGTVTSLGAINVEAPGGTPANTANLTITGATAVTTLGVIAIDGNLTLPGLTTVSKASTISALTILGGATVGNGLAGSSIGLITIGTSGNNVSFDFATFNGAARAGANVTAVNFLDATVDISTNGGPAPQDMTASFPGGAVSGGVTAEYAV